MSEDAGDWKVEVFIEAGDTLGEGPIWWKRRNLLAWVDILECRIRTATWTGQIVDSYVMPEPVGCIFEMPDGSLLAGCQSGLRTVPDGELVARLPDASPDIRINDGKIDPWGNLVFGTMGFPDPVDGAGTLWRWDGSDFSALLEGLTIPNGMVWRNSGSELLFIDTPTQQVVSFQVDAGHPRKHSKAVFLDAGCLDGVPDGMCEASGHLYVAMWGGGSLVQHAANSDTTVIRLPCENPTSVVAVPGANSLIVTSATAGPGNGGSLYLLSTQVP